MAKRNFLLGKGERLAEAIRIGSPPVVKVAPYTFEEARQRLAPMVNNVSSEIEKLPADACPEDLAVATVTMNPEYLAKSYFPSELLRTVGLEPIGSKAKAVTPEKRSGDREPKETLTTELFVVGKRPSFKRWAEMFQNLDESDPGASQIKSIESVSFPSPKQKIKVDKSKDKNIYEVVLHLDEESSENRFLNQFKDYLKKKNLTPDFSKRFYAGGLCFLEMEASPETRDYVAEFTLVRVMRTMPSLRLLQPAIRTGGVDKSMKVSIPDFKPLDSKIKVAIFDGGIPDNHPILKWAVNYDVPGIGNAVAELQEHGVGVTSAFLFGHIDPKVALPQPYANVDHYRVLDDVPGSNPYELFEILDRIKDVLDTNNYDFINLSLGPRLPIEDDEVHAWTAVLDDYLSKRPTLATIAVGNDGESDPTIGANRVQVPSDCVNALAVGACDVPDNNWLRAPYSSVRPGRSPGITKPDLVDFGGSIQRPFLVLDSIDGQQIIPTGGTSFAAPSVMRLGSGVKAHFGSSLSTLAIRTLLVHCCEQSDIPKDEVGFGRIARSLDDIVICNDREVRVVFQGRISASKYIRTPIPVPVAPLNGRVKIKATLCYATAVDPHHPENYTRSGLEVSFRPNKDKRTIDKKTGRESVNAATKTFFGALKKEFQTELELRRDALKWENCMHAEKSFQATSLKDPVFDIHYNARLEGRNDSRSQEIEYALVITVQAPKVSDLYDQVVRRYATILEQLTPIVDIPVRV
jgi:hypothetical protein